MTTLKSTWQFSVEVSLHDMAHMKNLCRGMGFTMREKNWFSWGWNILYTCYHRVGRVLWLWNTILSCLVIVVGACHRSMVRGGAHCACLAATAVQEMILLALPCLAMQHNMHQMRWLVLQGALFLTKKTNESLTLDSGPGPTRLIFLSMNFLWNLPYPLWRSW